MDTSPSAFSRQLLVDGADRPAERRPGEIGALRVTPAAGRDSELPGSHSQSDLSRNLPCGGTICGIIEHQASRRPQTTFCTVVVGRERRSITFEQLLEGARRHGEAMLETGLEPGDRVGLMQPTSIEHLLCHFGALSVGIIPASLAPPLVAPEQERFARNHADNLTRIGATALITSAGWTKTADAIRQQSPTVKQALSLDDLPRGHRTPAESTRPQPNDAAIVQFSSGSGGHQKAVGLTHKNLLSNVVAVQHVLQTTPEDVLVIWLPLYHDMGLLGCVYQALFAGCRLVLMPPAAFIASPLSWLRLIDEYSGTIGVAPNSCYQLCIDRSRHGTLGALDLSSWRLALNGAEMVMEETLDRFTDTFGPCGFKKRVFMPVYGLAEATVAVCFTPPNTGPLVDRVDRLLLESENVAEPTVDPVKNACFVSVGNPIPGVRVKIVDREGNDLSDRRVGKLLVRSPSVMSGYLDEPSATEAVLRAGWLDTGDLAYKVRSEIFIVGRSKDVIIKGGRNFIPEHFEHAVSRLSDVRTNGVVAFGVPDSESGTERIVLLIEAKTRDNVQRRSLAREAIRAIAKELAVTPDDVFVVPPRTIPRTTSGKVQRPRCRRLFTDGLLPTPED